MSASVSAWIYNAYVRGCTLYMAEDVHYMRVWMYVFVSAHCIYVMHVSVLILE